MKTLTAGAVLLSIWSGLNLLLAVVILLAMTLFARNAPCLSILHSDGEIAALDPKLLLTVNALAVLANACIVALCTLVLIVIWTCLVANARWAFWALAVSLCPLQAFGFVSDAFMGHRNLVANLVSSAILVAGLSLSDWAMHRLRPSPSAPATHQPGTQRTS